MTILQLEVVDVRIFVVVVVGLGVVEGLVCSVVVVEVVFTVVVLTEEEEV